MESNLMGLLALAPLLVLLLMATQQDIRSCRISNKLVLIGMIFGGVLNGLLPMGNGFNSAIPGGG